MGDTAIDGGDDASRPDSNDVGADVLVDASSDASDVGDASKDTACTGECVPGATDTVTGTCAGVFEKKLRTCGTDCTWGAGECRIPSGWQTMKASPLAGRCNQALLWSGSKVLVWGGTPDPESSTNLVDGSVYDLATDTWTAMAAAPAALSTHGGFSYAFGGGQMFIWGGTNNTSTYYADGALYDLAANTWTPVAAPTTPSPRTFTQAVYASTTGEVLLWGGQNATTKLADGAAFTILTGSFTAMPTSPLSARFNDVSIWTGTQAFFFAGRDTSGGFLADGARYNPVTKVWTKLDDVPVGYSNRFAAHAGAVNGAVVMYGGGTVSGTFASDGLAFDAAGHSTLISPAPTSALARPDRYGAAMWCSDSAARCWIWSGASALSATELTVNADGASFTYPGLSWAPMTVTGAPAPRVFSKSIWTGKSAVVWGGSDDVASGHCTNSGGIFTP